MHPALVRGLVLRWVARHRLRSALGVLAVALGVAAFLASLAVARAVVQTGSAATHALAGGADLVVQADETGLPGAAVAAVRGTPGVRAAAPVVATWLRVAAGKPSPDSPRAMVVGVDPAAEAAMRRRGGVDPTAGLRVADPLAFASGTGVLVAKPLAERLGVAPPATLTIRGARGDARFVVAGTFDAPATGDAARVALVPIAVARALAARGDRVDRIDVTLDDGAPADATAAAIRDRLAGSAPASLHMNRPDAADPTMDDVLGGVDVGLKLGALVALLVGVFLIHHTVAVGVTERRREIGILRSLGATRGQVLAVFCAEALVLGLTGAGLGILLGWAVATTSLQGAAATISGTYFPSEPAPVEVSPGLALAGLAAGAVVALLAAWGPAHRAASEPPSDAVRRGPETSARGESIPRVAAWVAIAGVVAAAAFVFGPRVPRAGYLAIFCLLVSFVAAAPYMLLAGAKVLAPALARLGVPGRLAAGELARHPRRAALPAAALAFGLALVVETLGIVTSISQGTIEWMEQNVAGDAFVSSGRTVLAAGGHSPLDASIAGDIARLPGVAHVVGVRTLRVPWRDTRVFLLALDIPPFRRMTHLTIRTSRARDAALADLETGTACLVSDNFAVLHGVVEGGDVDLPAADGTVRLRVVGTFPDYSWPAGTVLLSRAVVADRMRDGLVDQCSVVLAPGTDVATFTRSVEAALGDGRDLVVTSGAEFRAAARGLLEDFFKLGWAQVAVSLAVAFLGVFNSLWIAVVMRRREIGLFRAAGATRGQVTASVVLQAASLGAMGAAFGIAGGIAVQWVALHRVLVDDTGWVTAMRVPWPALAAVAVLGVATSALAGLVPARVAARTEVRDAIGYE